MMRKFVLLAAALLLAPMAAQAQQQAQKTPPELEAVLLAYRQLGLAITQLQASDERGAAALQHRIEDMAEYGRKCGDIPGCWAPVK